LNFIGNLNQKVIILFCKDKLKDYRLNPTSGSSPVFLTLPPAPPLKVKGRSENTG